MNIELIAQSVAVERSKKAYLESLEAPTKLPGADIGIHTLNMTMGGHMRKKLTTIAGRSGHGKTASVIPMFDASTRIVGGKRPAFLFFTWEMPSEEVVSRYISYKTGYSWRMLFQASKLLNNEAKKAISDAYDIAKTLPILYQEMSIDSETIRKAAEGFVVKCEKMSKRDGVEVVPVIVIDYVGMGKFKGSHALRTHALSEFMYDLKGYSKEQDAHYIALAQINRSSDQKEMPDKDDLSDSQGIEQASDNLIILHRPEYQKKLTIKLPTGEETPSMNKAVLRQVKGRAFGVGDVIVNCDIKCNRFWDSSHTHDFEYWKLYDDEKFWRKVFGI